MRLLFICLAAFSILAGCKKQCGNKYYCDFGTVDVKFIGFDANEIDTVFVINYSKTDNFTLPIDTTTHLLRIENGVGYLDDRAPYYGNPVNADYNSEIVIPGIKTIKISNISMNTAYYRCCDEGNGLGCAHSYNPCPIVSYKQDGTTHSSIPVVINK